MTVTRSRTARSLLVARDEGGEDRFVAYWHAGLGDRMLRALRWVGTERHDLVVAVSRDEGGPAQP